MSEDLVGGEEPTTNRRTLLKGAVAAGVGVAAYSSPIISSVPAYATHGLSSWTVESDLLCIWFSPNHDSEYGDWHPGVGDLAGVYNEPSGTGDHDANAGLTSVASWNNPFTVGYYVNGIERQVRWGGHPNNFRTTTSGLDETMGTYTGTIVDDNTDGYQGGGIKIQLLDPTCEFLVVSIYNGGKDQWATPTGKDGGATSIACAEPSGVSLTTSWADGNSSEPITPSNPPDGTVPSPWQGDATRTVYYHTGQDRKENNKPWSMFFRIRCT